MTAETPLPIVVAPATVVAPEILSTAEKDADSKRVMAERIAPTTTAEEDRKTLAQRRINSTWEITQAMIAMTVTMATVATCSYIVVYGDSDQKSAAFLLLSNVFFMVIATYFTRTNHTKSAAGGTETR